MCIGCVLSAGFDRPASAAPGGPADRGLPGAPDLQEWSTADTAKATVIYRQLPRWSRRLFDLLSSAPGRRFGISETRARVFAANDPPFGLDDVCGWAEALCAASGRPLPVQHEPLGPGGAGYWMDQPAALLFHDLATRSGS
jgi:hypothetical protein